MCSDPSLQNSHDPLSDEVLESRPVHEDKGWGRGAGRFDPLLGGNGYRIQRAVTAVEFRECLLQHSSETWLIPLDRARKKQV